MSNWHCEMVGVISINNKQFQYKNLMKNEQNLQSNVIQWCQYVVFRFHSFFLIPKSILDEIIDEVKKQKKIILLRSTN